MNQRTLNKIVSIFREGASAQVCVALIIELTATKSALEVGIAIHKFYEHIFKLEIKQIEVKI
jgi:hypothetical protein